jgi:hypothetical protein
MPHHRHFKGAEHRREYAAGPLCHLSDELCGRFKRALGVTGSEGGSNHAHGNQTNGVCACEGCMLFLWPTHPLSLSHHPFASHTCASLRGRARVPPVQRGTAAAASRSHDHHPRSHDSANKKTAGHQHTRARRSMDFSECYRCSGPPAFSPDGQFLAAPVEYRLVIRDVESLKVVQIYSCLDKIHSVQWSPNSKCVARALDAWPGAAEQQRLACWPSMPQRVRACATPLPRTGMCCAGCTTAAWCRRGRCTTRSGPARWTRGPQASRQPGAGRASCGALVCAAWSSR